MKNKKVLFFNKMNELIEMGFDLEKNSALDFISAVYELIAVEKVLGNIEESFENMEKYLLNDERKWRESNENNDL